MRYKNTQARRLRRIPLFSKCTTRQLRRIDSLMTQVGAKSGQVLISEGCREGQFMVVLEGTASAFRGDTVVECLGPDEFFGEVAARDSDRRFSKVIADSDMRLLVSSRREFWYMHGLVAAASQRATTEGAIARPRIVVTPATLTVKNSLSGSTSEICQVQAERGC
jgi:CRP/FNR family cyclic AMP-dependent transcriptional regulator